MSEQSLMSDYAGRDGAVTSQPTSAGLPGPPEGSTGTCPRPEGREQARGEEGERAGEPATLEGADTGIHVRAMVESDSEALGELNMDAFQGKVIWAAGKNNKAGMKKLISEAYRTSRDQYHRTLVAVVGSEPVGACHMKYHGDKPVGQDMTYTGYINYRGLCGLICMEIVMNAGLDVNTKGLAMVDVLCVSETMRGRGIGRILLQEAEIEARKRGCDRIGLYVVHTNRAKNLYLREGYEIISKKSSCWFWCVSGIKRYDYMEKPLS